MTTSFSQSQWASPEQYNNPSYSQKIRENSNHQLMIDHYNYPPINRKDLMSLQSIEKDESGYGSLMRNNTMRDTNLRIGDIQGTQSRVRAPNMQKPNQYEVRDIEGSQPRPLVQYKTFSKESHILSNSDITGSQPNINKFKTNRPPCNPLEPSYKLQNVDVVLAPTNKFLRDTLNIRDIDGATAKKSGFLAYDKVYPDIDGTRARDRYIPRDHIDQLNVQDINGKKALSSVTRLVNPLNPQYKWNVSEDKFPIEQQTIGFIEGSISKHVHQPIQQNFQKLSGADIQGAQASSLVQRYSLNNRQTLEKEEIQGTKPNTRKIGIQTIRQLNPLQPQYQIPGHSETNNVFGGFLRQSKNPDQRSALAISASQSLIPRYQ